MMRHCSALPASTRSCPYLYRLGLRRARAIGAFPTAIGAKAAYTLIVR
jgi:hypothetical protein